MESPRERCEEPDYMCSENCFVWTSTCAQTPINVVSSPLPPFCLDILVSSFLTQIPFTLSHFFSPCSNKKILMYYYSLLKMFSLDPKCPQKNCSFLLGRIFLLSYFSCFLKSLVSFLFCLRFKNYS